MIGLPGDEIELVNGFVRRNGDERPEEYVKRGNRSRDMVVKFIVPRDHLYVLSDFRRGYRHDSRTFGPISVQAILGRLKTSGR